MNNPPKSPPPGRTSIKRWIKRIIWSLILLGLTAGVVLSAMPQPVEVELAVVKKDEFLVTVNEDGVSRIHDRYVVSAPLAGTLARLELHPGDEVEQGQIIARILPLSTPLLDSRSKSEAQARVSAASAGLRQANAQIERAKVAVEYAQKEAEATQSLARKGTVSEIELDRARLEERSSQAELTSAQFAAKVANHELAMARAALVRFSGDSASKDDQFEVTSPSTGRVLRVLQQSEGVVQAGAPLVEMGDPEALEVAVDVLTSDAPEIKPGAHVSLSGWGGPPLPALVRLVEPAAFSKVSALGVEEQRVNTIIDLNAPPEQYRALGDGYRVEASIEVYKNDSALQIPWSCLFRDGQDWAVFRAQESVARKTSVKVGRRNETHAEILSGLSPDQKVLRHPSDRIKDGVKITEIP